MPADSNRRSGKPLVLLILDGWGWREAAPDNAITVASTPHWDRLLREAPLSLLETSGAAVGLPAGQMGNSEVGHLNIGAGRIVPQDLQRIGRALENGELLRHEEFRGAIRQCRDRDGTVHVIGMVSPGGVHSHEDHILALLPQLEQLGAGKIAVHAITDGRDTPPRSAHTSIERLQERIGQLDNGQLATVSGRFYAMDRDRRWERIQQAWDAIVEARAEHHTDSGTNAIGEAYARGEGDEFIQPTVIGCGCPVRDCDLVICCNFRADRMRQLCRALAEPGFDACCRPQPRLTRLITFTDYLDELPALVLFEPVPLDHLLGEELANAGLRQLRLAETEKYAHVTFFFNGGEDRAFRNEERVLIPSPKIRTYDLKPEMSAQEVGERLVQAICSRAFDVIICNIANPDMVGHTGHFEAALDAVQTVDQLLGDVRAAIAAAGGELLITADHGNVEQMSGDDGRQQHTAHTMNPAPLVYVGPRRLELADGALCDIAPTMLDLLGLEQPAAMTGRSLILAAEDQTGRRDRRARSTA